MNADLIHEFGRLRQPPSDLMEMQLFESRQWIIKSLIEMRKAGIFRAVWCDENRLAIVLHSPHDLKGEIRQSISWLDALKMVEEFKTQSGVLIPNEQAPLLVERKPPTRSTLPNEAKTKACR